MEDGSRNHSGCLCEWNVENKCVSKISTYDQVGECYHVLLLDLYISEMPQKAKEMDYFYLRPLDSKPQDSSSPWYYRRSGNFRVKNNSRKKFSC